MKNFYTCRVFVLLALFLSINSKISAQKGVSKWIEEIRKTSSFAEEKLVKSSKKSVQNPSVENSEVKESTSIELDQAKLSDLWQKPRPTVTLALPIAGRNPIIVELARIQVTTANFKVSTNITLSKNSTIDEGVHYRGIVKDDTSSVVSISIYKDEIRGFVSDKTGKYEIGKLKNNTSEHVIYNANALQINQPFACGSDSKTLPKSKLVNSNLRATSGVGCKVVTVFFECDYQMYLDNGSSVANVTNYVTSFFNQVATLYQNDNIDIQISEIYVWTTPDPYRALTTTSTVLQAYDTNRGSNFNGTLAHFLTTRNIGGGIAYVNILCNKSYAHGVSMIYNSFSTYPTYSWTVECVTHELGHNLGSNHTQWCGWVKPDGSTGPIDNCAAVEGTCTTAGPAPTNGGTIMSYCHKTAYGINFANGFGSLPGNAIRLAITNATCLTTTISTAAAPTGQQTTNISNTGASLSWNAVPNIVSYSVDYKPTSSSTWTTLGSYTSATAPLSGLIANSSYDWRVKGDCSAYSTTTTFLTTGASTCAAPTSLTSSNLASNSATLTWGATAGATNYTVQYKISTATTWTTATTTTNTYSLAGLTASTAYNWQVKASCSAAYSATANFTTIAAVCAAPSIMTNSNITSNAATLTWGAITGATNYTIQYKTSTATAWTTAATVTTNTYNLTGLVASTTYNWQVKASCSAYSTTKSFSTITASCTTPTGLASSSITSNSATLVWNAVSGATNYTVQYKTSTATAWTTAATVTTTNYSLTGLTASTAYNWQVKASCSAYSTITNFSTISASCAAPTGLTNSPITSNSATLVWNAVSGATNYTVQYKTSTATTWTTAATVTTTNYSLTGLVASTAYNWQVKASCSAYSAITNFSTIAASCTAPTGLASVNVSTTSATLVWNIVSGAASYTIQYKVSTASAWTTAATITSNAYSLTGLTKTTTYNYQVKANCSVYSSTASLTTLTTAATKKALIAAYPNISLIEGIKNVDFSLPAETTRFSVYPNPAQDNISLNISNNEEIGGESMYRIVDFKGNIRKIQRIKESAEKIDISDLERGAYFIQMLSKSGVVESKTLVKEQ